MVRSQVADASCLGLKTLTMTIVLVATLVLVLFFATRSYGADLPPRCVKPALPPAKKQVASVATIYMDPSHNCPKCGLYRNQVFQVNGGLHSHRCLDCGIEWWHGNSGGGVRDFRIPELPDSEVVTYRITPASAGCASGNCSVPTSNTRWYPGKLLGR